MNKIPKSKSNDKMEKNEECIIDNEIILSTFIFMLYNIPYIYVKHLKI